MAFSENVYVLTDMHRATLNGATMSVNAITVNDAKVGESFSYSELANGFSAVSNIFEAHDKLRNEVVFEQQLENTACDLIRSICDVNASLKTEVPADFEGDDTLELGRLSRRVSNRFPGLSNVLRSECPHFDGDLLAARVSISLRKPSFVLISQARLTNATETLVRRVFLRTLQHNPGASFTFVDLVGGGNAFPFAQEFMTTFPNRSDGRVCTNERDFERVISSLSDASAKAISLLGDNYESANAYNAAHKKSIPKRFVAILLSDASYHIDANLKELATIASNRDKNNMGIIIVGRDELVSRLSSLSDLHIRDTGSGLYAGRTGDIEFGLQLHNPIDEIDTHSLMDAMKTSGKVDTSFESNTSIFPEDLSLESSEALRIPFALGDSGELQYFEIGGAAATHALISGKTGSGKSVALHTLIMQIICNYHPDDVEIWAIDYKAVEFDWYIKHRAPHFKVIARESSDEFSYSLLDLIYEEYEKRQELFLQEGVSGIGQYRRKMGPRSMPRIVVFIDEFQIMTQAVQSYTGEKDYRKVLENLLRLTRAMGISFVFCSQTVASGLGGLTDAARDQIACRLCLQQQSAEEIRETLAINGPDETGVIRQVENLRKGQAVYKRARWQNEHSPDGKAYETKLVSIVYMPEEQRAAAIERIKERLGVDYRPKDEIIVRGEARVTLFSKARHPVVRYIGGDETPQGDYVEWYPAAPASLADSFKVNLEDAAGSNILMVGENDDLRDSLVTHSVIGWLADPRNAVVATFVNENYPDRKRMIEQLRRLKSRRLTINVGTDAARSTLSSLRRIRPNYETRTIYLWYGLDRLENELFLAQQEGDIGSPRIEGDRAKTPQTALDDLTDFLNSLNSTPGSAGGESLAASESELDFSDCRSIIRQAFERGPENNLYHLAIFNNRKGMKKSGMVDLSDFDNRIGSKMSSEDAYDLFGSSQAMNKAGSSTVIYSAGSGRGIPLRPYLMPSDEDYSLINMAMEKIDGEAIG